MPGAVDVETVVRAALRRLKAPPYGLGGQLLGELHRQRRGLLGLRRLREESLHTREEAIASPTCTLLVRGASLPRFDMRGTPEALPMHDKSKLEAIVRFPAAVRKRPYSQ